MKNCLNCKKKLGDPRSVRCKSCAQLGELSVHWKGNKAGLKAIHRWLRKHYGIPNKCENPNCEGKSKFHQWAKLKGKEYEHKRENYWQLCASCHLKYDYTDERRKKVGEVSSQRVHSKETKNKISISGKKAWKRRKYELAI